MKPTLKYVLLILITTTSFFSCSKDENDTVSEKIEGHAEISIVLTLMGDYEGWDIGFIGKTTTTQTTNADYKLTYENTGLVNEEGYLKVIQIQEGVQQHTFTSGKRVDQLALLLTVPYPDTSVNNFEYKIEVFVDGVLKESYMTQLTTENYGNYLSTHKHLYKIEGGLLLTP